MATPRTSPPTKAEFRNCFATFRLKTTQRRLKNIGQVKEGKRRSTQLLQLALGTERKRISFFFLGGGVELGREITPKN